MTVNEFAQDVHKNAVAHGWYDAPITFPEVAVMIHAEISEAVEEWRSGNPVIYGTCALSPENCKFSKICDNVGHPSGADTEGNCKRRALRSNSAMRSCASWISLRSWA